MTYIIRKKFHLAIIIFVESTTRARDCLSLYIYKTYMYIRISYVDFGIETDKTNTYYFLTKQFYSYIRFCVYQIFSLQFLTLNIKRS